MMLADEWNQLEGAVMDVLPREILDAEAKRVGGEEVPPPAGGFLAFSTERSERRGNRGEGVQDQDHNAHHDVLRGGEYLDFHG